MKSSFKFTYKSSWLVIGYLIHKILSSPPKSPIVPTHLITPTTSLSCSETKINGYPSNQNNLPLQHTHAKDLSTQVSCSNSNYRRSSTISKAKEPERKLADIWRDIHGVDDWDGMLDPLDPLLRSELIRYGEMVQACYDAFDFEPFSKYCGCCKYAPSEFFECLGMTQHG